MKDLKSAMSTKVYWKARKLIQSTNEACSYIRSASKGYTISPLLDFSNRPMDKSWKQKYREGSLEGLLLGGLFCGDSWTRTNGLTALRLFGQVRNTRLASLPLAILVYSPRFRLASSATGGASAPRPN